MLLLPLPEPLGSLCFKELGVSSALLIRILGSFTSFGVPGLLSSPTALSILLSLVKDFCSIVEADIFCCPMFCLEFMFRILSKPLVCCFPEGFNEAILSVEPCIVVWLRLPIFIPVLICVSDESSFVCDSVSLFRSSEISFL